MVHSAVTFFAFLWATDQYQQATLTAIEYFIPAEDREQLRARIATPPESFSDILEDGLVFGVLRLHLVVSIFGTSMPGLQPVVHEFIIPLATAFLCLCARAGGLESSWGQLEPVVNPVNDLFDARLLLGCGLVVLLFWLPLGVTTYDALPGLIVAAAGRSNGLLGCIRRQPQELASRAIIADFGLEVLDRRNSSQGRTLGLSRGGKGGIGCVLSSFFRHEFEESAAVHGWCMFRVSDFG